jgi:hypothetical protein
MATKPNETGFNLKSANLMADPSGEEPEIPEEEEEPVDETKTVDPDQLARNQIISCEDRVARRNLIMEIQGYYSSSRFGPFLNKGGFVEDLSELTIEEMTGLLDDMRVAIQNKNGSDMIQRGVPQLIGACEPVISQFYDIRGTALYLASSESFKDILEELALENRRYTNTPASTRLCFEIAKGAFFVHEMNAAKGKMQVAEKPVQLSSKHADLVS